MVKTYLLAPNWSTAPPPYGPIKLGHILNDLTEFVPLNRSGFIDVPQCDLNKIDTKSGFQTSRGKLLSGELGIFAKVIGLLRVGIGAAIPYSKGENDILCCKTLDTMTFDPKEEYIAESMGQPEVKNYMQGCRFKRPVYMVTGLKIGRGGSLQSSSNQNAGITLEGSLNPPRSPIQIAVEGRLAQKKGESESWEGSTDFIVAFRVRKIWYKHEKLKNKAYNKNVVMQDGSPHQKGQSITLQADDDIVWADIFSDMKILIDTDVVGGEEVNWIIPKFSSRADWDIAP